MKILLIDDDINLNKVVSYQLNKRGYEVTSTYNGEEGLQLFQNEPFDIVITDIQMPGFSGIDLLKQVRKLSREVIVIIITAYGSVDNAIDTCRIGADDYLTKPFSQEQLTFVIEKAKKLRKLQRENVRLRDEVEDKYSITNMVAHGAKMKELARMTLQVAASDATVLIQGESGTGKELIAKAIHFNSPRKDKPMITINCPSIPDNLLESELFGHVKGAFTGALKDRKGKFEMADGGTIFLDEIGDLKDELQAKLLRVLQENEIEKVGETKIIKVDVRVVAATNKNLPQLIEQGTFRQDLYYRLSVIPIIIPPLRERKEDVPFLTDLFIQRYSKEQKIEIEPQVIVALQEYDWPGNIRELENLIERLLVLSASGKITLHDLPSSLLQKVSSLHSFSSLPGESKTLKDVESTAISKALQEANGNQSEAARLLDIPRHVLLYRMEKLGLKKRR